jgi:hypothetical protein
MVGIPSIPYADLKANHTLSGTAEPNARVLLWNPAEGRYVRTVDADTSGNFDFGSIDASVPLQVKIASDNDFTCVSSSAVIKPAVSFNTLKGKVIRNITTIFSLNAANYIWAGTPKIVFSDAAGSGSGAEAFLTMAGAGELALTGFGGPPVAFELGTSPNGSAWTQPGYTIKSFTITSIGSNYTNPKCFVVGTRLIWEQDPANANQYILVGQSVSVEQSLTTSETAETIVDQNSLLSNFGITWGATNTWGDYSNPSDTGRRLLVQFPSLSTINYNVSCTTEDSTQPGPTLQEKLAQIWMEGWTPNAEDTLIGANYGLYLKLIHGHSGATLGVATNKITGQAATNLDNSALVAMNNGVIFYEELAYLKGWIATEVQVKAMVNRYTSGWASYVAANSVIFNNYVYKPLLTWITDFALVSHNINDAFRRWEPNSNVSQYFGLGPSFAKEWQDAAVQSVGAFDSANDRGIARVRSILTKLGNHYSGDFINSITTTDDTGTYRWDFSGNTLQKIKIN